MLLLVLKVEYISVGIVLLHTWKLLLNITIILPPAMGSKVEIDGSLKSYESRQQEPVKSIFMGSKLKKKWSFTYFQHAYNNKNRCTTPCLLSSFSTCHLPYSSLLSEKLAWSHSPEPPHLPPPRPPSSTSTPDGLLGRHGCLLKIAAVEEHRGRQRTLFSVTARCENSKNLRGSGWKRKNAIQNKQGEADARWGAEG